MALINCKECKGKISSEADSCPHCGCKDPVPAKCIACGGWIYDESKPCPNCGDPNLPHAKDTTESSDTTAKSGSTVECRKCGKAVSPNAEVCPHCSCTEPAPVECQACGSDVDHEKAICPKCGHPLDCPKGKEKLIKCRKCGNQTSTEAEGCPKCNCTDPIIEPLPFVKCREKDCDSIIHKEAKHCPNCGCKDPAPSDASTLKSNDYADAVYLVKRKGDKPERFITYEIIAKIKIGQILPQQQITFDGPDEYQHWRPAYYYLPFAEYEDYDAAAKKVADEKAAARKAANVIAAAEKAAAEEAANVKADEEKAEKKLRRKLLYACTPALFFNGSGTAILLAKFFSPDFGDAEADALRRDFTINSLFSAKQLLGIVHSDFGYAILCGAVAFGLALGIVLFDPWRSRVAAVMLSAWYCIAMFYFIIFVNYYELKPVALLFIIIILGSLALTFGIIKQLQIIEDRKIDDGLLAGDLAEKACRG